VDSIDLKDIKAIIDLMRKNSISEFELENQVFKIRMKRGTNGGGTTATAEEAPVLTYVQPPLAVGPASITVAAPAPTPTNEFEIKSPMIGTFYRAPSPESASYVEVGTEVNPETVVCIIEAMKVMNEITSKVHGEVVAVLVENGEPVEFGQPLMLVKPAGGMAGHPAP
jgi:acetyl-CoA carboxylase biotin carboxyl carrier protein